MKISSVSRTIRELQVKTTVTHLLESLTRTRMIAWRVSGVWSSRTRLLGWGRVRPPPEAACRFSKSYAPTQQQHFGPLYFTVWTYHLLFICSHAVDIWVVPNIQIITVIAAMNICEQTFMWECVLSSSQVIGRGRVGHVWVLKKLNTHLPYEMKRSKILLYYG